LVSVPSKLSRLQFPPGPVLAERCPDGFGDLANVGYPMVERSAELSTAYGRNGLAVAAAVGCALGITIDDYVFMDMGGISDLSDGVGGVTIELDRAEDIPLNVADPTRPAPPRVGPGEVRMDGPLAIGCAQRRYADSGTTARGRCHCRVELMAIRTRRSITALIPHIRPPCESDGPLLVLHGLRWSRTAGAGWSHTRRWS
jgi:hypothetical protein